MYLNNESSLQSTEPDQIKYCVFCNGVSNLNATYLTSGLMLDFDSTVLPGTGSEPCITSRLLFLIDPCFNDIIFVLKTDTIDLGFTGIAASESKSEITLLPELESR